MQHRLLAVLAAALVLTLAAPAAAYVDVASDLHSEYDGCVAKFTAAGMRDLIDQLDKSKHKFTFVRKSGTVSNPDDKSDAADGTGTGGETWWNPDAGSVFADGVKEDRCATLYHEMQHLVDYDNGKNRNDNCFYLDSNGKLVDSGISVKEVNATRKENLYRAAQKPPLDKRTAYGRDKNGNPLMLPPDGTNCEPAPPAPPSRWGCSCNAVGAGDPHLKTYDDKFYDLQAIGEFILTKSVGSSDALEVQGRMGAPNGLRTASLFTAVAANASGDRVGFYRVPGGITVYSAGKQIQPPVGVTPLPKGGQIEAFADGQVTLTWPDKSTLDVLAVGGGSLRVIVSLAESRRGKVEGVFGNFDGKPEGDLVARGGAPIGDTPSFEALYRTFGDSWRIKQPESLFDYAQGQTTETFTDRTFPDRQLSAKDLPNRATAEAVCRRAGVTEGRSLDDCILDVGLTGEPAFAADAVTTQVFASASGTTLLSVAKPGDEARLTFQGTKGQIVFVDALQATIKDECFPLHLLDPKDNQLNGSCLIGGRGFIDATVLPADGQYAIAFKPAVAGQVRVRITTATDQEGSVSIDGPIATATIGQPGAVDRLHFNGTAGERVFIDVLSSTLADDCFPVQLLSPVNAKIGFGCVINGQGFVDGVVLPSTGQYTILIDPAERHVGITQLRLIRATDQIGSIIVNGPAVTANVSRPGAQVKLTFNAVAGQKLSAQVSGSTLGDDCFPLQIRDATATVSLVFGCVIDGKGETQTWTVPATGTYTVVIDPRAALTGASQVRLVIV